MPSALGENVLGMKILLFVHTTNTVMASVAVQPPLLVTVRVYVVVTLGTALGFGQVVQLNPVVGDHKIPKTSAEYCPFNCKSVVPEEMVISGPTLTVGKEKTLIRTESVVVKHPLKSEPVTV